MELKVINPRSLVRPRGYNHGVLARGSLLFVAGQVGWDGEGRLVSPDSFPEQLDKALENVLAVVREGGGGPENISRMVFYVTSKQEYLDSIKMVGEVYRKHMGRHFPAMVLVEVKGLLEDGAKVEVEAIAVI